MCDPPPVGTQVEIQGLKNRTDLNGKRGWVTVYDQDADRVEVSFDGPSREKVKVKPVNAVPVKNLQASGDGLNVGACVEIMGLQGRADLNGRRGSVISRDDAAGRIEVQLDGLAFQFQERVKVKLSNAKIAKDGLAVGVNVEISDLQSRPELNGRRGQIIGREIAADLMGNDRLEIHLDGPNGGERIKCKPSCVKLASKGVDLSAAIEMAAAAARQRTKNRGTDAGMGEDHDRRDREHGSERGSDRDRDYDRGREDRRSERSRSRPRVSSAPQVPARVEEDRSGDWVCVCGERNFRKRSECYRCHAGRSSNAMSYKEVSNFIAEQKRLNPPAPRFSRPMRGPRGDFGGPLGDWTTAKGLLADSDWDNLRKRIDARKRRSSSSSSSSSKAPSRKKKKKKRSRSKSSSASSEKSFGQLENSVAKPNTELDKLKNAALQRLLKIKEEPPETRKKSWRGLLLEWHPDKHPEDTQNATAIFQFLQKGKALLDLKDAS